MEIWCPIGVVPVAGNIRYEVADMKIGTMLNDVIVSLFLPPATQLYPFERRGGPVRLRAHLIWDKQSCTGCGVCSMDCPSNAIDVIAIDKKSNQIVIRYHLDRCTFCAQCVSSCMKGSLSFINDEWEFAALNKKTFKIFYGDPEDVGQVLAGSIE